MKRPPRDMLEAALLYGELFDWIVFPAPPGTKRSYKPAKYSNGVRWGATNKPAIIERDFRRWPDANLGIPTGPENGFWVLEADTPKGHDVDGIASLRALERKHGRLPKTLMVVSPSGSLHYYFRWPKGDLIVCSSASKIAAGVDVRGAGGMVLAPPSVKAGVGHYRFLNWGTSGAYAPRWLLELVTRKPVMELTAADTSSCSYDPIAADIIEFALIMIAAASVRLEDWTYQRWFEIGCALHFELGDDGFSLFDRWSAKSPKYNAAHCAAKWRECRKLSNLPKHYTGATILFYADQVSPGWRRVFEAQRWAKFAWAHR